MHSMRVHAWTYNHTVAGLHVCSCVPIRCSCTPRMTKRALNFSGATTRLSRRQCVTFARCWCRRLERHASARTRCAARGPVRGGTAHCECDHDTAGTLSLVGPAPCQRGSTLLLRARHARGARRGAALPSGGVGAPTGATSEPLQLEHTAVIKLSAVSLGPCSRALLSPTCLLKRLPRSI